MTPWTGWEIRDSKLYFTDFGVRSRCSVTYSKELPSLWRVNIIWLSLIEHGLDSTLDRHWIYRLYAYLTSSLYIVSQFSCKAIVYNPLSNHNHDCYPLMMSVSYFNYTQRVSCVYILTRYVEWFSTWYRIDYLSATLPVIFLNNRIRKTAAYPRLPHVDSYIARTEARSKTEKPLRKLARNCKTEAR